jgi:uncharacterized membrane protein
LYTLKELEIGKVYPETSRSFESNKILGGVGSILTAIGSFIPFSPSMGIVYIIGIILVLISMKGLSEDLKDLAIFRNAFNGFIFGIIGAVVGIASFAVIIASIFSGFTFTRPLYSAFGILLAIGALLVVFGLLVIASVFFKRAFEILESKSGEKLFRTGGLLLLVGAVLIIIFGLGFVLLFVAWILIGVAFFSMRAQTQTVSTQPPTPVAPSMGSTPEGNVKYCSYCGAENKLEATFCTHCGRRIG